MSVPTPPRYHNARPWYWDAVASFALFGMAFGLGKFFGKFLPLIGLLFFAVFAGFGYHFAKSAWLAVTTGRTHNRNGKRR